jgi:hypothetical protein
MKLENLERVRTLLDQSRKLRNIIPAYKAVAGVGSCDKYALKFGGDDRFSVFKAQVFLDCHTGTYGSSSCYTMCGIPNADAQEFLNQALNKNMKLILEDMAMFAEQKALALKAKAEAELKIAQDLLASIYEEAIV